MRKYKNQFLWRNIFYSKFTIIFILLLILFVSNGIFKLYKKYQYTKAEYLYVEKERLDAEKKMNTNQLKLTNINTPEGKERYIRETYSVKKEGEGMIIVYSAPSSTYEIPKAESSWKEFVEFLKNLLHL